MLTICVQAGGESSRMGKDKALMSFLGRPLIQRVVDRLSPIADEIIVLDSGSEDKTVEIVKGYTDKVYVTDWPGYGPQKQRALARDFWAVIITLNIV